MIIGAGLSLPEVSPVAELTPRLREISERIGVTLNGDFYDIAEAVLNHISEQGMSDAESRLWLAQELGLLDDRKWFGEIGLPLCGNTPRHRALARFAVEERIKAVINLNWDALLEVALQSVGLKERKGSPLPWRSDAYAAVVQDSDLPLLKHNGVLPVIKLHGCVRSLTKARRVANATGITPNLIFKIKKSELETLKQEQVGLLDTQFKSYIAQCPLIAIGWKASEAYLREAIITTVAKAQPHADDVFTLTARSWYPNKDCNDPYHGEIADAYKTNEITAFAAVERSGRPTLDCLFLWLQARFALKMLIGAAVESDKPPLRAFLQQLDQPNHLEPILPWVDKWLPSWVRLCWRAGVMNGIDPISNQKISSWEIPLVPRDVHVPLSGISAERQELLAATKLLIALREKMSRFDFDMFPGGFWDKDRRCLYLPLPGWIIVGQGADLAALAPFIDALRSRFGFVKQLVLVYLTTTEIKPSEAILKQLESLIKRLMPTTKFATDLSWTDIDSLNGEPNEHVG